MSDVITQQQVYEEMSSLGAAYAKAKKNRVYISKFLKSKKALLMIDSAANNPSMTAAIQERNAYAHPEYIELLEGLKSSTEIEEVAKNKLDIIKMKFEAWRTKSANRRNEKQIEQTLT